MFVSPTGPGNARDAPTATSGTTPRTNRVRYSGPPALGPVPDKPRPPNGCTPTTAPMVLRLI